MDGGAALTKKKSETMRNAASMDIIEPNTVASVRSLRMHRTSARQRTHGVMNEDPRRRELRERLHDRATRTAGPCGRSLSP